MGLDLNTALISDTFDGLIKTTDANALTGSPLVLTDGRGNNSSLALATAGNGVAITGGLTVDGTNISTAVNQAQADITAIETKTDFITVTGAVNLDTINTKAGFITVTQAVDLDTIESQAASASTKTAFITVTQAVDLDTMESDILSAKTKTDFITIGQPVNLDNLEADLATAEADIIAIETKTDFITITQAVNLDTVEANAAAAKTKTDFLTVTQAVDLDTLESDVNVAKGDITAIETKTDFITVTQAVNLDTIESDLASSKAKTDFITVTQAVNLDTIESGLSQAQTDINLIEAKTNNITVTQAVNLDTMESDIATNNTKNSYPSGDATKVGFISVTQAVDLDSMETDISNLSTNKYDKTGGTISGAVTVTGDLTVNGTTTTVNTQTLSVKDPLIELANDNDANSVDTGFYANYSEDAGVTTKYAGLFRDAGDSDKFKLFKGLEVEPTTTVDTAGTGYAKGDLVVNDLDAVTISGALTGNVSGNLTGNVSGNVTGNVTGDLTGTVTATSVLADGVTATTQATSDNSTKVATTAFVKAVVTAEDLDIAGDTGTGAVDLDSQVLTIAGTANEIETSASGQTITIGLPSGVTVGTLTATTLAGTLSTAAQPNITSVGTLSSLTVAGALNGTISTAAQPNITSVGTLSSLAVSGNLTVDTNTLFVDAASNNVGIGTSSPSTYGKFAVSGTGSIINATSTSGTAAIGLWESSVSRFFLATLGGSDGLVFIDGDGSSERMRIDSSGNVGIGASDITAVGSYKVLELNGSATNGGYLRLSSSDVEQGYVASNSGGLTYDASAGGDHFFYSSGSEKMRITSGGDVLIGTIGNISSVESGIATTIVSGDYAILNIGNTRTTSQKTMRFYNGNGEVGSISTNASATSYTTSSDYRLKENVVPMEGALDRVGQLNPTRFKFIADPERTVDGFLAHEVAEVVPEAITGEKDAVDEEGNPIYQGIDQSKIVPLLVGAIQELKAEIETLKAQING